MYLRNNLEPHRNSKLVLLQDNRVSQVLVLSRVMVQEQGLVLILGLELVQRLVSMLGLELVQRLALLQELKRV
jgi:hypothetical protein